MIFYEKANCASEPLFMVLMGLGSLRLGEKRRETVRTKSHEKSRGNKRNTSNFH